MKRKNTKRRSLKVLALRLWVIISAALLLFFLLFALIFIRSNQNEVRRANRILSEHYSERMDADIRRMSDFVDEMYVNNVFFHRLVWYTLDDYDWIDNTWHIQSTLKEKTSGMNFSGGHFYYDAAHDSLRSAFSADSEDSLLGDRLLPWMRERAITTDGSGFLSSNDHIWYVRFKGLRGKYLGFLIDLSAYIGADGSEGVVYLDGSNRVVCRSGDIEIPDASISALVRQGSEVRVRNLYMNLSELSSSPLKIVTASEQDTLSAVLRRPDFLSMMVLLPVTAFFLLVYLYRLHSRALLIPTQHILRKVEEMRNDPKAEETQEDTGSGIGEIEEYQAINDQIDRLLQEIDALSEARHREELNTKNALLQYYQLQIDPHFYLNCLNSISSLLQNRTPEIANDMIMALSSHFRYVFQSSRTLVTVSEELRELQNYTSIYSIKGGVPILLSTDVPDRLMNVRIPILAIQTFVENSIKHVTKKGRILSVRVQVFEDPEAHLLVLRITDNGPGYPDNLLQELNRKIDDYNFDAEHVGILNLKYRCRLLYEEKAHFSFYNAPAGGAVSEITIPSDPMCPAEES